jgi:hypothetical protein
MALSRLSAARNDFAAKLDRAIPSVASKLIEAQLIPNDNT